MSTPEKKVPSPTRSELKAEALTKATDALSKRVGNLADAVQMNNAVIAEFKHELAKKPDDVEVKVITGMATAERQRHFLWAIGVAFICAILSGLVSYRVSEMRGAERCKANAQNVGTIVAILEEAAEPRLQPHIDDLKSNRNSCE